jgi:cytoskeletal protein CcmA (bactofilin family)
MLRISKDKHENVRLADPAVMHSAEPALTDPTSSISRGVTVAGKIFGEGTLQLFGRIEGEVRVATVLIKEGAQVEGDVVAEELTIAGQVKGTIHANRVKLDSTAVVEGDIFHRSLSIDENARFEGSSKREDNARGTPRSPLSRSSIQDDRQTNVTNIDAIDPLERALNVVAALGEGSRLSDLSPKALSAELKGTGEALSSSPTVAPSDTEPSR